MEIEGGSFLMEYWKCKCYVQRTRAVQSGSSTLCHEDVAMCTCVTMLDGVMAWVSKVLLGVGNMGHCSES